MQFTKKRVAVAAATTVAAMGVAGVGFAYWNGSVSTTASNGTVTADGSLSPVTTSAGTVSGLYPGGPAVNVPVTLTNPNTATSVNVSGFINGSYASAVPTTCSETEAALTITKTAFTNVKIPAGGTATVNLPVSMADSGTGTSQTDCQGAAITLSVAYSAS